MKFKNFEGVEYEVIYAKPHGRYPTLQTRRQLNVLIEEAFHAHLYDLPEKKARKFAANLGKLIYNRFLKQ